VIHLVNSNIFTKIVKNIQKKGDAIKHLPFLFYVLIVKKIRQSEISCPNLAAHSRLMCFNFNFFCQAGVVFAENDQNLFTAKMIRNIGAFG